ncbi:MAG TPA: FecR domain-containing protein [Rhizomicrobium sp.]|nr:FecR domain-containing protein [Rhizomicrobium sp.]
MSEAFGRKLDAPSALGVEARAADWFDRKHFWTWTDADQAEFDAWLAESPAHEIAYWRLQGAWGRAGRLSVLHLKRPARWRGTFLVPVAAAMVLVTAMATGYWMYASRPQTAGYATKLGGRETVSFSDGTRVELNTNTAIRVAYTANTRAFWLDKGEAYFQVKHDAAHPLTVYVGDRRITDIGTKFDIRRESGGLEVAVVEGRVGFDAAAAPQNSSPLLLTKGEAVVATATDMSVVRKSDRELMNELSWRRGVIIFDGTPLAEAAREMNRYNDQKIVIADPKLGRIAVTGTVSVNDPQQFIRMTQYLLGLRGEQANGEIVISR